MHRPFCRRILLPALIAVGALRAPAQLSTGTITGTIGAWRPEEAATVLVRLQEAGTGTIVQETAPGQAGTFTFRNVPFATYAVNIVERNSILMSRTVRVHSTVPCTVAFDTLKEYSLGEITVESPAGVLPSVSPRTTTHSLYTTATIADLPTVSAGKTIEAILLNTPGVVPDEDGRMHVRGEDAQLQYVVNGIPITGNLTRVYSSLFNASIVKSVDIQTGGLNAEYGVATSGVISVTTRSGFDRPLFGRVAGLAGSFGHREAVAEAGGTIDGNTAIYLAGSTGSTDRYLDPITSGAPNHDGGTTQSYFGSVSTLFGASADFTLLGMYNRTKFEVPNQLVKTPAQDQRQTLNDYLLGARVNVSVNPASVLSGMLFTRRSQAEVTSGGLGRIASPADSQKAVAENEKFFVGGKRTYTTSGGQIEFSSRTDWFDLPNTFKAGIDAEIFPVSEFFTFAVTNPALSNPDTVGGDDRYLPYDITRGGSPFVVDQAKTGRRFSGFVQDELQSGAWTLSLGLRFDSFTLKETESALSPRAAASYSLSDDLVLRASYNRIVMQAPVENFLVSSSDEARALAGTEQGSVPTSVRSEKSHVFELGGAYRLNPWLDFDLSGYAKVIDDFLVKVELGNSGVIFPVNLKQGIVAGGELRMRLREWNNLSGFLSVGTCVSRGMVPEDGSTPFAAGLVLGEEGEAYSNPFKGEDSFPTEHNQLLTAAFGVTYRHPGGAFATVGGRLDSGLPFDLTGPNGEALNEEQSRAELIRRGYTQEVIDLLELAPETAGSPDRSVAPHAVFDATVGYDLLPAAGFPLSLSVTVLNLFDTLYLYKFESTFGGTHFGVPRTVVGRVELRY